MRRKKQYVAQNGVGNFSAEVIDERHVTQSFFNEKVEKHRRVLRITEKAPKCPKTMWEVMNPESRLEANEIVVVELLYSGLTMEEEPKSETKTKKINAE